MAGHSQFKNIMHRKGAQDVKRAKIFNKLAREITVAAKSGLPDPAMNPRLRAAVQAARERNMPKDRIDRAISSAVGGDAADYESIRYEGYGPGGVALIVEALTDNRNRTASEVRSAFTKHGGALGETNSVSFMFQRLGVITYPGKAGSGDAMFEAAAEAGADNVDSEGGEHEITTSVENFAGVRDALDEKFGSAQGAALEWRPLTTTAPTPEQAESLMKLIDALEDNDDVQSVAANAELSDELAERLSRVTSVRVLGIDPGLGHTGWGVIECDGNRLRPVAYGAIATDARRDLAERLAEIHKALVHIVAEWMPEEAAIEEVFVNRNPASTLKLGMARGIALLVPAMAGMKIAEYAANLVKKSVVGTGHADKAQVAMMVGRILPGAVAQADAADALAVAICHAHHRTRITLAPAAGGGSLRHAESDLRSRGRGKVP